MPRPIKAGELKRDYIVRVRVTASEKNLLKKAADESGYTLSDFVRVKSLNAVPRFRKPTPERAAMLQGLSELGKIGGNLNQIAKGINSAMLTGTLAPTSQQVRHALVQLDLLTTQLLTALENGH